MEDTLFSGNPKELNICVMLGPILVAPILYLHPWETMTKFWILKICVVFLIEDISCQVLDSRAIVSDTKFDEVRGMQKNIPGPFNILSFDNFCAGIATMLVSEDNEQVVWTILAPSASDFNFLYTGVVVAVKSKLKCRRHIFENNGKDMKVKRSESNNGYLY